MLQDPNLRIPIAISLGAIVGALSRYYLTLWFVKVFGVEFPYGTFLINLTGCLGMGFVATLASDRLVNIPPEVLLMVTTGFLGAYTTFSTYGLDTIKLLHNASRADVPCNFAAAGFYWAGSAVLGVISVQLGSILAGWGQ